MWPFSRTGFLKQFLCLTGNESLFQQTAQRLAAFGKDSIKVAAPVIVSGEDHRFLASEQLREVGIAIGTALLEPMGRNTAPTLTLAALAAVQNCQDPVLVVTSADQTIANPAAFAAAVQQAISQAEQGNIVILAGTPDKPETGYGYICTAQSISSPLSAIPLQVLSFVEKPNQTTAEAYIKEGGYYWNAGMFVLKASVWLAAIDQFAPAILQATRTAWAARKTYGAFVRPGIAEFEAIPSESVDYAVMEHCPGSAFPIQMVPLNAGWSDLVAWEAVWQVQPKDAEGNAHVGDVLHTDSHNTLFHSGSSLSIAQSVDGIQDRSAAQKDSVIDKLFCSNFERTAEMRYSSASNKSRYLSA